MRRGSARVRRQRPEVAPALPRVPTVVFLPLRPYDRVQVQSRTEEGEHSYVLATLPRHGQPGSLQERRHHVLDRILVHSVHLGFGCARFVADRTPSNKLGFHFSDSEGCGQYRVTSIRHGGQQLLGNSIRTRSCSALSRPSSSCNSSRVAAMADSVAAICASKPLAKLSSIISCAPFFRHSSRRFVGRAPEISVFRV